MERFLPEGMLSASPENAAAFGSKEALRRAAAEGRILEAPVTLCDENMRLWTDLRCMRGVMERDECVWCRPGEYIKDIAVLSRVGKPVAFRILRFAEIAGEEVAVLSRRAAQSECAAALFRTLTPGDVIPARVTHLEPYGAFVDIGCGVSSLLSIDCISVSRIAHPCDRLTVGTDIFVAVKSIDRDLWRIFVTLKELLGTWEENAARFRAGETVVGRVRSVESYGIFVELTPNLAGLAELRGNSGRAVRAAVGDAAAVYIKSILPERMKVKLVIIDAHAADIPPEPLSYYIDPAKIKHIDYWEYSPACSTRLIETIF